MADFWIVTDRKPVRHFDFEKAEAERDRLNKMLPAKDFRLLRCKTRLRQTGDYENTTALLRRALAILEPECEQRKTGGNDEDFAELEQLVCEIQSLFAAQNAPPQDDPLMAEAGRPPEQKEAA